MEGVRLPVAGVELAEDDLLPVSELYDVDCTRPLPGSCSGRGIGLLLAGGVAAERALIVAKPELGGGAFTVAKPEADAGGGGRVSYVDEICRGGGAVERFEDGGVATWGGLANGDEGRPLTLNGGLSMGPGPGGGAVDCEGPPWACGGGGAVL